MGGDPCHHTDQDAHRGLSLPAEQRSKERRVNPGRVAGPEHGRDRDRLGKARGEAGALACGCARARVAVLVECGVRGAARVVLGPYRCAARVDDTHFGVAELHCSQPAALRFDGSTVPWKTTRAYAPHGRPSQVLPVPWTVLSLIT